MISVYIESGKNEEMAQHFYFVRYPERRQPFKDIFRRLEHNTALLRCRNLVYCIFEENLKTDRYLAILQSSLFDILDDAFLNEVIEIYFQQDGAPTHNALRIRENLHKPDQRIHWAFAE